jgi:hypothetical protein
MTLSDDTMAKIDGLSDDALTEKVAEAVGAVWKSNCGVNRWHWPSGTITNDCPDYARDLNAMHEAESDMRLKLGHFEVALRYLNWLKKITGASEAPIFATARQRAKAFIVTMMEDKP